MGYLARFASGFNPSFFIWYRSVDSFNPRISAAFR
jgi:hypothetical protein